MISRVTAALGDSLPDAPATEEVKVDRRSLLQSSVLPPKTDPIRLPFSKAIQNTMLFVSAEITDYKKDAGLLRFPTCAKFYTPRADAECKLSWDKTHPSINDSTLSVFKVPVKGLPVTFQPNEINNFYKGFRSVLQIASYMDWAFMAANNEVLRATRVEGLEEKDPELYGRLNSIIQIHISCAKSWSHMVQNVTTMYANLVLRQRDVILAKAPQCLLPTELSELRKQPIFCAEIFDSFVTSSKMEEKIAARSNQSAMTRMSYALQKPAPRANQPPQKKFDGGQKGGSGPPKKEFRDWRAPDWNDRDRGNDRGNDFRHNQGPPRSRGRGGGANYAGRGRGGQQKRR